ncbi:MAG: HIRAN domain-containing protein [Candidatus Methylophosphatis roskildensis]|jgi:hypothetical protein|nr:HIRAN domain-containing protein [Sterolibacteriaceae bacterium]MBK9087402.1 HIRAN domain-containing protein [Sterolibacteriaceae bacterium]
MRSPLIEALRLCAAIVLALAAQANAVGQEVRILVQSSPLAGFRYYAGETLWQEMKVGDELALVREPDNAHDANAVRVQWRGHKLGYLPRAENRAVAAEMDRGAPVVARIAALLQDRNPWKRLRVDIYVVL